MILKEDVSCPNPSQSLVWQLKCGGEMENGEMREEEWSKLFWTMFAVVQFPARPVQPCWVILVAVSSL